MNLKKNEQLVYLMHKLFYLLSKNTILINQNRLLVYCDSNDQGSNV